MPQANQPPPMPPKPAMPAAKPSKLMIVAWILVGLLALSTVWLAWLYFNQSDEINQTDDNSAQVAETGEEAEEEAPLRTVYQAEVGKFKLDLDPTYAVVENLDGGFEGGPATSIEIGIVASDTPGVVSNSPAQAFMIFAVPDEGATLADNSRVDTLSSNDLATRKDDTTFAGTPARVYEVDGLFTTQHIVFVKNDLVYEITMLKGDKTQTTTLAAVKTGFSFVE